MKYMKQQLFRQERTGTMDVRDYLDQIRCFDSKLEITRQEIRKLKSAATSISIKNAEKVQCSLVGDMSDKVVEYTDLEQALIASEKNFFYKRAQVMNFIFQSMNALHIRILYGKYVELKKLYTIAAELGLSEQYVREKHLDAIKELEAIVEKKEKERENNKNI